jgi:hypothetical protein
MIIAIYTCVLTAFSEVSQKDFILRCCLLRLKESVTFLRFLYKPAIPSGLNAKLLVRKITIVFFNDYIKNMPGKETTERTHICPNSYSC